MELIDKAAVVAEIDKLKGKVDDGSSYCNGWQHALRMLEIELNTLEVKEVDFEKDLEEWVKYGPHTNYPWCTIPDAIKITAEHFFELGLRYKSSYGSIPNIDDTLKEMGVDPNSKEANTFKESYFRVLDKLQAK